MILAKTHDLEVSKFNIDKRYGFCELLDDVGNPITNNHDTGELVGTSFDNLSMPLLRFKTGDFCSYHDVAKGSLRQIKGRWEQEFLHGYNGSKVFLSALNLHSDVFNNVIQYQFYQDEVGVVIIRAIVDSNFKDEDSALILKALHDKVEGTINFKLTKVENLLLSPRGKLKRIIRNIDGKE
ncbi:hypothetical protein BCT28_15475 [Vibrio breoganii]|nr:hypothetical protein BCT28_15475 [Vibrio breoganii]